MNTTENAKKEYQELVKEFSKNSKLAVNCLKAFVIGGLICTFGQFINNLLANAGLTKDDRSLYTSVILIFLASLFTGLGLYHKFGKFGGAGSFVPITGFSNSVTAPAIEFKKEGLVAGIGAKMFIVAGPVIVYGLLSSIIVGLIYYFMK